MKKCPVCQTTYADDSLRFCLTDGAGLLTLPDGEETVAFGAGSNPIRVDVVPETTPAFVSPTSPPLPVGRKKASLFVWLFAALIVAVFLGGVVVVAAWLVIKNGRDANNSKVSTANPSPTATAKNTSSNETQQMKDQIANLQKQLEKQKNEKQDSSGMPTPKPGGGTTARVNSPGDGFLALRSEPDSEKGSRILQIPHGEYIAVSGCKSYVTIGKKTGRWCQTSYDGYSGWVFDAWLEY